MGQKLVAGFFGEEPLAAIAIDQTGQPLIKARSQEAANELAALVEDITALPCGIDCDIPQGQPCRINAHTDSPPSEYCIPQGAPLQLRTGFVEQNEGHIASLGMSGDVPP